MKKLSVLLAAMLLAGVCVPGSAEEFVVNGVKMSNVCANAKGERYQYEGFFGPVGTPCTWTIGEYQYWGKFGG